MRYLILVILTLAACDHVGQPETQSMFSEVEIGECFEFDGSTYQKASEYGTSERQFSPDELVQIVSC